VLIIFLFFFFILIKIIGIFRILLPVNITRKRFAFYIIFVLIFLCILIIIVESDITILYFKYIITVVIFLWFLIFNLNIFQNIILIFIIKIKQFVYHFISFWRQFFLYNWTKYFVVQRIDAIVVFISFRIIFHIFNQTQKDNNSNNILKIENSNVTFNNNN
jgi:hypothetical protein